MSFPQTMEAVCSRRYEYWALQEFAGYCLWHENKFGRFLALSGGRQECRAFVLGLMAILRPSRVMRLRADHLDSLQGRAELVDKDVVFSLAPVHEILSGAYFTEIVDGVPIPVARSVWECISLKPRCKLIVISERPSDFYRWSGYVTERMLTVNLDRRLDPLEFNHLKKSLRDQESIWKWAERGYLRLLAQDGFTTIRRVIK